MEEIDKKEYELAVLVKNEEDLAGILTVVRDNGGEVSVEPRAKRLALAYEIKKNKEAVFAFCTFKMLPAGAKQLEYDLNNKADVLRFLIIASPAPVSAGEHEVGAVAGKRPARVMRSAPSGADAKPSAPKPLSNEALEKKIEEILK
jgi:ribosomal protein S6